MKSEREIDTSTEILRPAVQVTALRRMSAERSMMVRSELAATISAVLAEVPGAVIEMSMIAAADSMIDARVTVRGEQADEIAPIVIELVDVIAEADCQPASYTDASLTGRWPIYPADCGGHLGFAFDDRGESAPEWEPSAVVDAAALAGGLASSTEAGIRVELRSTGDPKRFDARLTALGIGAVPSVQLRSLIRRRFDGLVVAANANHRWLPVRAEYLAGVIVIPVGGPDPVPGFFTAPAAPIPVSPSRQAASGNAIRLGHAITMANRTMPVTISEHERVRHVQILGRTGTGKSSAIAGMMHELAAAGEGGLVLDPHGTLVNRILEEMPAAAVDRVWVIRCGDVTNPVPLSTLAESDPVRRDIAIADTCAIFQEVFDKKDTGIVGPRFRERISMGMRALCALHGDSASVLDVPVVLANDLAMTKAIEACDDDRLTAWFKNDKGARRSSDHGELVSWVDSKFEAFAATAAMRAILGSGRHAIDFAAAMDDNRIILVDLSKAELGESAARLVGYMYLNRVWAGALRRKRRDVPFTVIVDEAQSLISGALSSMLAEGRKFGLSIVLAHQYLDQLDEYLRPAVDGNVATTIAFRSAAGDTPTLGMRFGGMVDATTLTTLPDLSAVIMRSSAPTAVPYTLVVDHNERVEHRDKAIVDRIREQVEQQSRAGLVDPYRSETTAAAQGKSRIAEIRAKVESGLPKRDRPKPRRTEGNFLDEWLAKRHNQVAANTDADTTGPDGPGSSDQSTSETDPDNQASDVRSDQNENGDNRQKVEL